MTSDAESQTGRPSVLALPGYRRLWAARTISQWGDVVQFTTLALLVLHLTGSGLGVSGAVIAEVVPVVVLAPLAGTVVDRLPRVAVMVAADLVRVILASILTVWHANLGVVYAVAFGLSAGSVFFNPAAGSLVPSLVSNDQLVAANSYIWSVAVLSQVALAPVAGIMAGTVGYGAAFALNAASFAASAVLLAGLRSCEAPLPLAHPGVWSEARRGLAAVAADRLLRRLVLAQALAALSAGATSALLVVLLRHHLHASTASYGLALAAIGAGAFIGPLALSRLPTRYRHARLVFAAFSLRGIVDLILASVGVLPAALGALVAYGLGTSTGNVSFSSLIQTRVPDQTRGRVFSAFDLVWHSARLVSIAAGGAIGDAYGIQAIYYAGGSQLLLAAITGVGVTSPRSTQAEPTGHEETQ